MDFETDSSVPEFLRVPVNYSTRGLIEYLEDKARRHDLDLVGLRIFMSQTQLMSVDEMDALIEQLDVDTVFQLTEVLALNETVWVEYPPVHQLLECLDSGVFAQMDERIANNTATGGVTEVLWRTLLCIVYRRYQQGNSAALGIVRDFIDRLALAPDAIEAFASNVSPRIGEVVMPLLLAEAPTEEAVPQLEEPDIPHPAVGMWRAGEFNDQVPVLRSPDEWFDELVTIATSGSADDLAVYSAWADWVSAWQAVNGEDGAVARLDDLSAEAVLVIVGAVSPAAEPLVPARLYLEVYERIIGMLSDSADHRAGPMAGVEQWLVLHGRLPSADRPNINFHEDIARLAEAGVLLDSEVEQCLAVFKP